MKTSAHTPYALTILEAAKAGLSSVEHIDYLIKAGSPLEAQIGAAYAAGELTYGEASDRFVETFDADYVRGVYEQLAATGLAVTPTLNMGRILAYLDRVDHSDAPELALIAPGLRTTSAWRDNPATTAPTGQDPPPPPAHMRPP